MVKTKLPIFEPEHYIGWAIIVGVIIGIFHLLGVHGLHTPWYNVLILYGVLIIVDTINHVIKLQ